MDQSAIKNKIQELIDAGAMPGMSYAIIDDDKFLHGVIGNIQLEPSLEVATENTLYDIASLTKIVSIVPIISKLIDEKRLSFNDKVNKYLPNFKYDDVTIYHLLTHTSGLQPDVDNKDIITKNEMLQKIDTFGKGYETGTKVVYSDLGYIYLGLIIEKIYNKPLDIVAKKEIFEPLEMYQTTYKPTNKELCAPTEKTEARGIVRGIVHDEKACSLGGVAGNAGVFTTAIDLSHFAQMILNNGKYNGKQILSKEIIDILFKPLVDEKQNDRTRSLCWITGKNDLVIDNNENYDVISFTGFTGPSISIDRTNNLAIILMTNRTYPTRDNKILGRRRTEITKQIYNTLIKNKEYTM